MISTASSIVASRERIPILIEVMSLEVIAVLVCDIPKRHNVINGADGHPKVSITSRLLTSM